MFQLTFLGTSGSTPTVERGMPAIAIKYESELLLWDCGEGTQRQLMKYRVGYGSINAIFISHPHLDHYLGLFGLLETLKLSSPSPKPVKIFSSGHLDFSNYLFVSPTKIRSGKIYSGHGFTITAFPVKHCKGAYGFIFQEDDRVKFHEEKSHKLGLKGKLFKEIQKKGEIKIGDKVIRLEDVTWVRPGKKIVYTGDCYPDESLFEAAKDADLLIHEATFDSSMTEEALERLHSTVELAANTAKRTNVKQLLLTHISPRYSDTASLLEQAKAIFSNTSFAIDGLTVDL